MATYGQFYNICYISVSLCTYCGFYLNLNSEEKANLLRRYGSIVGEKDKELRFAHSYWIIVQTISYAARCVMIT